MKSYIFTVDDNIRVLKELSRGEYRDIFQHPYLSMYKRLHEKFGIKVQLNLFLQDEDFSLFEMTDKFKSQWEEASSWLKLSFHSRLEDVRPYEHSGYEPLFSHACDTNSQIVRFAGESSLAKTTTIHYCLATEAGLDAIKDNGYIGLLGLFGARNDPRTSYERRAAVAEKIRDGEIVKESDIYFGGIDIILNLFSKEEILSRLLAIKNRDNIKIMIHEQYFYEDYHMYIPEFEEILICCFEFFENYGFSPIFFEEIL